MVNILTNFGFNKRDGRKGLGTVDVGILELEKGEGKRKR